MEKEILVLKFKIKANFAAGFSLDMYFHQIDGVEFIYDSHGQTFLFSLYKEASKMRKMGKTSCICF